MGMTNQRAIILLSQMYLPAFDEEEKDAITKAIEALTAQEPATEQPKRIDLQEDTKAWLDEMDAVEVLGTIADICQDWDGYRTANDLGGLINEIWAYARYCADRLLKAQEPRVMSLEEIQHTDAVWLETHGWVGGDVQETVLRCRSDFENYVTEFATNDDCDITCVNSKIGIEWRCWTSKPDEKVRTETPWESVK